jgi:endothelin-converting enzyme
MRFRSALVSLVVATTVAFGYAQGPALKSGVLLTGMDKTVRPQDDFFRYVNGGWLKNTEIPADHTSIGAFVDARDEAERHIRTLIEEASKSPTIAQHDAQQIGDLCASYMKAGTEMGGTPIRPSSTKSTRSRLGLSSRSASANSP